MSALAEREAEAFEFLTTVQGDRVFEIRQPLSKREVLVGFFDAPGKAIDEMRKHRMLADTVYTTLQEIDPRHLHRGPNKIQTGKATSAKFVRRYRWILLDFDPVRPDDIAACTGEVSAARELAGTVEEKLSLRGFAPPPLRVMSGNGIHLIYPYIPGAAENVETSERRVKAFLRALSVDCSTEQTKLDTSVYDRPRVTKLPGSLATKGANTKERPHRVARILRGP